MSESQNSAQSNLMTIVTQVIDKCYLRQIEAQNELILERLPAALPGKTADSSRTPSIDADRENAEKLRSALREMKAIGKKSSTNEGFLRSETGLTGREYRRAINLLIAEKAVRTGTRAGTWLVS